MTITVRVNGQSREIEVAPHCTLLELLRDRLHLTGTKECCSEGECGACTVMLNGRAVNSCLILAVEAHGDEITTIEGLGSDDRLNPLQTAFLANGAVQCGFCIPGILVAARALLNENPHPSRQEIQDGLEGNLCRCAGYSKIIEAVEKAAEAER